MKRLKHIFIWLAIIWIGVVSFDKRPVIWKGNYRNDYVVYQGVQIGTFTDSFAVNKGTAYREYYIDGSMDKPQLIQNWTNYTWDVTNANINITNATFGTLHGGDIVTIPFRSTGYNSNFQFSGIGAQNEGSYITIDFGTSGAFITPTVSPDGTGGFDNSNWVKIEGIRMDDNINNLFAHYAVTAVSQHIWIDHAHLRGTNGYFPSSPHSLSIPNFANDTSKAFLDWTISYGDADSLVGANSGATSLLLGQAGAANQFFIGMQLIADTFRHYSSASGPAGYVNISQCFGCTMAGCVEDQLGMNVPNPNGHAALNVFQDGWWLIYNNLFAYRNFGTCIRIFNNSDLVAFPNYWGITQIFNNKDLDSRKYCMVESRSTTGDDIAGVSRHRTGPHIWNNLVYNAGIGTGLTPPSAYKAGLYEIYDTDSVWVKNNYVVMCPDSVFTSTDGPFIWTWSGSEVPARLDTGGNFTQTVWAGLADSVNYYVTRGGFLNGTGVAVPSFITTDWFGSPRTVGGLVDVGPTELQPLPHSTITIKKGNVIVQKM